MFNDCWGCEVESSDIVSWCHRYEEDEDDLQIMEFLKRHGLLSDDVLCPRCYCVCKANFKRRTFVCNRMKTVNKKKKKCRYEENPFSGTLFSGSKLSVSKVMQLVLIWLTKNPPRQKFLQRELELSPKTIVHWLSICREVTFQWSLKNCETIGGNGKIVEFDEAKFGCQNNNQERNLDGQWVFGGVEQGNRSKFFIVPVETRNRETILSIIKEKIDPGTTIIR